jgi:type I restriction-modification system DNA methylase subunit
MFIKQNTEMDFALFAGSTIQKKKQQPFVFAIMGQMLIASVIGQHIPFHILIEVMSIQTVRNERGVKLTMSELIAGIALMVTLFSALNGWVVLPEQMRSIQANDAKQDARIEMINKENQERSETLARIDERTKRIEEYLKSKGF